MNLNTLTGLIIFHLPLWILSLLFFSLWFWGVGRGANPHILHRLGSPAFWLSVGFGKWRYWLEVRGQERERLSICLFSPCFRTVVLVAAPLPPTSIILLSAHLLSAVLFCGSSAY